MLFFCSATGDVYFGQTNNLRDRFSFTRSKFINKDPNLPSSALRDAVMEYGLAFFVFIPLYIFSNNANLSFFKIEKALIQLNSPDVYNIVYRKKLSLNKPDKKPVIEARRYYTGRTLLSIKGQRYDSINEAVKKTGINHKKIRKLLKDINNKDFFIIGDDKSQNWPEEYWLLPLYLYLVDNRVYLSQADVVKFETNNAPAVISDRFKKGDFSGWKTITRAEFFKNYQNDDWEYMWQWPNDQQLV